MIEHSFAVSLRMEGDFCTFLTDTGIQHSFAVSLRMEGDVFAPAVFDCQATVLLSPSAWRETCGACGREQVLITVLLSPSAWRETAKLHRKAFFISPILVQSCKKGCKRLHSAPEKMVFFEKREKNLVRNLQHLSVRL